MSSKTKRKYVYQEHLTELELPAEGQIIARVTQPRGNNLHQVEDAEGRVYLASMPNKFRKNIWVRRGTYVLLEPIAEGNKVRGEVVRVLSGDHVRYLRAENRWPERFEEGAPGRPAEPSAPGDLVPSLTTLDLGSNPNRRPDLYVPGANLGEEDESEEDESDVESDSDGDHSETGSEADRSSSDSQP